MPTELIKVTFVLATLRAGGAERVYSFVSQNLDKNQFDTTLLVFGHERDAAFDTSGVKTIYLGADSVTKGVGKFFKYLKNNRPDLVCGSVIHVNVVLGLMSLLFLSTKFVGREVSVISLMDGYMPKTIPFQKQIRKFFYNRLDGLICQSKDMASDLSRQLNLRLEKLQVIANPITLPDKELVTYS